MFMYLIKAEASAAARPERAVAAGSPGGAAARRCPAVFALVCAAALVCLVFGAAAPAADGADSQAPSPFARLFDTGEAGKDPLTAAQVAERRGWTEVPEGTLAHAFKGAAAMLNDRLVVVLRAGADAQEVYSRTAAGLKRRATVAPLPPEPAGHARLESVRILENNPGAVMVEAVCRTRDGRGLSVRHRLTAGQGVIEVRPGDGAAKVYVGGEMRCLIVPDFFGDDMVFLPESLPRQRVGLPAENFLLGLIEDRGAMVVLAWQGRGRAATAVIVQDAGGPAVAGCEIEGARQEPVWIAFLEGAGLWHERPAGPQDADKKVAVDWSPPFPAKWRADVLVGGGFAQSETLAPPPDAGSRVRTLKPGRCIVYPIDRTRETPLTAFTPVDIMRSTLGVGPCQYVLEAEGLASQEDATPDQVMAWLDKQLKRNKSADAAQVKERLKAMAEHVGGAEGRIKRYAECVDEVRAILAAVPAGDAAKSVRQALAPTLDGMQEAIKAGLGVTPAADRAARLAGPLAEVAAKGEAGPEFQRMAAEARSIGAAQERALSKCRIAVRWLRQQCLTLEAGDPEQAAIAMKVRGRAERAVQM
jgi:hypothetical protein